MPSIDGTTLRLRTEGLDWRELDGEIVVLDLSQSEYFAVNRSGAVLWQEIARGATRRELIDALIKQFELGEEAAEADVRRFLDDLERRGLLAAEEV